MNRTDSYQEVNHKDGRKGIFAILENSNLGKIRILVGIDEQIARRIIFMVESGMAIDETLEEDLPFDEDLFNSNEYEEKFEPNFGGKIFIHKNFI